MEGLAAEKYQRDHRKVMHENYCTRTLLVSCKKKKWCLAMTSKIPAANLRRKLFANEKKGAATLEKPLQEFELSF